MQNGIDKKNPDRLTDQIYNQILAILHDRGITRSEKLSALSLSELLGVSRTPVSFALYRMQLEGLIYGEEKGGWNISPLTISELDEINEAQLIIFPAIVSLAAKKMSSDDDVKMFLLLDEIERSIKWNDLHSWRAADMGFNRLLAAAAGNQRLEYFAEMLNNQLYRLLTSYLAVSWSNKEIFLTYRDIAASISVRNSEIAKGLASTHTSNIGKELKNFLQNVILPLLGSDNHN